MDDVTGRTQLPPGPHGDAVRPTPLSSESGANLPDAENEAWRALASADSVPEVASAWLSLVSRRIPRVVQATLFEVEAGALATPPCAVWPKTSVCDPTALSLAERVLTDRKPLMQRATSDADAVIAAAPIAHGGRIVAIAAVSLLSSAGFEPVAVMRELQWSLAWIEAAILRERTAHALSPLGNERLATALTNISRTSPVRQAALGFVTELAQILDCDRVTLGFRTGKSARAFVISHSAGFGARTRLAQAIGSAMDEALDQEIPAAYPAGITAVPAVSRSQEALSREFESAGVLTVPFTALHGRGGAFTFERSRLPVFSPEEVDLCVSAARLAGPMLFVRRASERPLFFRFWSGVWSMLKAVFGPHYLPLKLMLAVAAIAVTATLLIEKDFRVTANAAIEGSVRRTISAPFDGYVSEAFTKSGDLVRQNDLLARLDDRDLQVERQKWQVEALKNRQKFVETLAENQRAEALAARSKLEQAEAQLVLVESSLARTRIVAPFDGTIVAGDLSQSLGAAVSRGQMLFEMAPLGDYRVRLKIDERDIADVAVGQKGELTLASFPTHAYPFEIDRVTLVSTAEDGINYFTVEAKLLEGNVPELRPGMAGLGAVTTVRRSIFWIYTHRLVDTVKLWLWSL